MRLLLTSIVTLTVLALASCSEVEPERLRGVIPGDEYLTMTPEDLAERLREDGYDEMAIATAVANKRDNQEVEATRLTRWRESFEHWEHVDAFQASIEVMMEDKVIGLQESREFCYKAPQWEDQLVAAQEYVVAYREIEPTEVAETPSLWKLEQEAARGLALLGEVECAPHSSQGR